MLKRFNEVFGIQATLEEERARFVNRVNQEIFPWAQEGSYELPARSIFEAICYWSGVNAGDLIREANQHNCNYYGEPIIPPLRELTRDNFLETAKILCFLHRIFEKHQRFLAVLGQRITLALENATIDLGIRWSDGMFYPSGADELDKSLVDEPYRWLADFPAERKDFQKALEAYLSNDYGEAIYRCYLVLEGLARQLLGNNKTLDDNKDALLKAIGLTNEWKAIVGRFIGYAHEFARHASKNRHNVNPVEAEAFIYQTGLLVRLIVRSKIAVPGTKGIGNG